MQKQQCMRTFLRGGNKDVPVHRGEEDISACPDYQNISLASGGLMLGPVPQ